MPRVPDAHRLFFALIPPADLLDKLAWLPDSETQSTAQPNNRLHVTMFLFDKEQEFQAAIATRIREVLHGQTLPICRVIFEQLVSDNGSTLLLPNGKLDSLLQLQSQLATLLRNANLHPASYWRFRPHMTLRLRGAISETLAIDAVSWTATDIVLLDSQIGLTQYDVIGRWPLTAIENK